MKKIIPFIAIFIISYATVAFILIEPNPFDWSVPSRFALFVLIIITSICRYIYKELTSED